jgi:hypothetical protein
MSSAILNRGEIPVFFVFKHMKDVDKSIGLEYLKVGDKYYKKSGKSYVDICAKHLRQKNHCKFCGGKSRCDHGRLKYMCKDCKGVGICEHGHRKRTCKTCDGNGLCKHGVAKETCKPCGGSVYCEHGTRRSRCKVCDGSEICEHGMNKFHCKKCGGSQICEHNMGKSQCKICSKHLLCEHGNFKRSCDDCGTSKKCEHGKETHKCSKCTPSLICQHAIFKQSCSKCNPNILCQHGKYKGQCPDCGGGKTCKNHTNVYCYTLGNPKYEGHCVRCFVYLFPDKKVSRNHRTKEQDVVLYVKEMFPNYDWRFNNKVPDGCSSRRPDIFCDFGSYVVIIEVDEHRHVNYTCENKRIMILMQDAGMRPIVIIRFNPDGYVDENGNKVTTCWGIDKNGHMSVKKCKKDEWSQRLSCLKNTIDHYVNNEPTKEVEVVHLFF